MDSSNGPALVPSQPIRRRGGSGFWSTVRFGIVCVMLFVGLRSVAPTYAIEGESMSPTFHDGGRVILNGAYRFMSPHHGDIIVFHPPYNSDKPYIKRVVALGGDHVTIHDGVVAVNGVDLDEGYVDGARTSCHYGAHCDLTVPEGYVYVLGDNRQNSSDSRVFGPVPESSIIGEVMVTIWK